MTKTPHKHAEAIKAWADGEQIEYRRPGDSRWVPAAPPAFVDDYEYRVKPARSYPTTAIHANRLVRFIEEARGVSHEGCLVDMANFVIRHAIDNGQVVTREEFALAIGDRDKRDMAIADAVDNAVRQGTGILRVGAGGYGVSFPTLDLKAIIAKVSNV